MTRHRAPSRPGQLAAGITAAGSLAVLVAWWASGSSPDEGPREAAVTAMPAPGRSVMPEAPVLSAARPASAVRTSHAEAGRAALAVQARTPEMSDDDQEAAVLKETGSATTGPGDSGVPGPGAVTGRGANEPAEETLYLTIVGNQTIMQRGPAGQRASRLLESAPGAVMAAGTGTMSGGTTDTWRNEGRSPVPAPSPAGGSGSDTGSSPGAGGEAAGSSGGSSGNDRGLEPLESGTAEDTRPWPVAACPWTLPPGSNQGTADMLQAQYGCRYLSSCSPVTGECSWHFQGTG